MQEDFQSQGSCTANCPAASAFWRPPGHSSYEHKVFFVQFSCGFPGFTWISRIQLLCKLRENCTLCCSEIYQDFSPFEKSHGQARQQPRYSNGPPATRVSLPCSSCVRNSTSTEKHTSLLLHTSNMKNSVHNLQLTIILLLLSAK